MTAALPPVLHIELRILVVMGVSGVGKSTIARRMADALGWPFAEGDDFHPEANRQKMASGTPLTDEDRWPWLRSIGTWMDIRLGAGENAVVACSALKRSYRDLLRAGRPTVRFCELDAPPGLIADRLEHRTGHYLPPALLPSQLAALEPLAEDEPGVRVSAAGPPDEIVRNALDALELTRLNRRDRRTRASMVDATGGGQSAVGERRSIVDTGAAETTTPVQAGVSRRMVLGGVTAAAAATTLLRGTAAEAKESPQRTRKRNQRVESLLRRMKTEEKLGQLQLLGDPTAAEAALAQSQLGGVFSVVGAAKLNALQKIAVDQTRLGIPLIFGLDVIHGYTTNFPIPLGQASAWDPEVAAIDAKIAAGEARPSGIHWTYAPMMDVTHEPRWGRIAEGDGEDPYLASQYAAAKTVAFQGASLDANVTLAACAKHFVAYGGAEGGRDYNTVDVSIQRLHNLYLPPFKAAVEAGVATVMTSFNTISGVPAHGNRYVVHDILKGRYGFDGFVVSDYTGIQELIPHGLAADGADAARNAMRAGVDMEMVSTNYVDHGLELLAQHKITMAQVDDAVRRILTVKDELGLFDHPYVDESGETTAPSADTRAAERAVARKSIVLLRNEAGSLPLSTSVGSIAVIGPLAKADYDLNGTWTGLGTGSLTTPPTTILDAITAAAPGAQVTYVQGCTVDGTDTSDIQDAVDAATAADVAILVVGETAAMSGEASARSDIGLPGVQQQLVDAVGGAQSKSVVVLVNGRPLTLTGVVAAVPAIVEAWAPGLEGGTAVAEVLFGAVNPGGKLPVSFPRAVGQIPIYYNHENTGRPYDPNNKYTSKYLDLPNGPLYAFGFGLSYTTFEISGLHLSSTRMSRHGGQIRVSATVKNTGSKDGDEVVQLYLHDPVASIVQPVRRLRGFERVTLKAGGSTTVRFTLGPDDVGFYDNDAKFVVEPGDIQVFVGNSSDASDLTDTFTVT